ncbi:11K virion structural protein [Homarus gammarus nudivirus]|uniref:11K virion structural protein n=1 Tax=Homarus gammarus nudivirus TaxID=2509616 RepID=A0A411HBD9_9VIRU|nr:11K virion structural protein [Homarus gammarus nudivirus]QBB28694.1 11K virion structural protein [Homarus gammarus nudivirus]
MQRSTASALMKPVCADIAKSMQLSGIIGIVVTVIIFIMLIFAAAYNNMYNPTDPDDIKKKDSYINSLIISSAIISIVCLATGIWHVYTSGKVKKCIDGNLTKT